MSTPQVCSVLAFLRENIRLGLDSLQSARSFAKGVDDLTPMGRLFFEAALSNDERLEEFFQKFVLCPSRARARRIEHRPRGRAGRHNRICG
jgi:hypothetical protein